MEPPVTEDKCSFSFRLCRLHDQIVSVAPAAAAVRSAVANVGGETELLEREDQHVARVRLAPAPSETRGTGTRVMVAMPVLALEQMEKREPGYVAARILTHRDPGFGVADAVNETLRVQSEAQTNRAEPKKC